MNAVRRRKPAALGLIPQKCVPLPIGHRAPELTREVFIYFMLNKSGAAHGLKVSRQLLCRLAEANKLHHVGVVADHFSDLGEGTQELAEVQFLVPLIPPVAERVER